MSTIRVVIVDDEALSRSVIREHLASFPDFELIAECVNGFEAVKAISELKPDVVFLDIQMPKLDGFEVLELIEHPCRIVFVTAFDQYALKAFEVHAIDYLLKPFSEERFGRAIQRMRELAMDTVVLSYAPLLESARDSRTSLERIVIRDGTRVVIVPTGDIDYIEAQDDYVRIVAEGKGHLKQERLSRLEALLPQSQFIRIHRSYIVNIDRVARIELFTKDSRIAILKDGTKLPVSRAGHERVRRLM